MHSAKDFRLTRRTFRVVVMFGMSVDEFEYHQFGEALMHDHSDAPGHET